MRIFDFAIWKEKQEVLSKEPCWCFMHSCYLYTSPTFIGLMKNVLSQWKDDANLIG